MTESALRQALRALIDLQTETSAGITWGTDPVAEKNLRIRWSAAWNSARAILTAPPAAEPQLPAKWTPEEVARGHVGLRWVTPEGVHGRPTPDDLRAELVAAGEPQAAPSEAWRDHVEQRLLTWRQRFVNKSGDSLALDDFMDKESLADLIDFVCDEWATPQPAPAAPAEPTDRNQLQRRLLGRPEHPGETMPVGHVPQTVTEEMVSRFLGWPLPKTFAPDCGISFTELAPPNSWPIGTNLFTATEARAMLEHVLAALPQPQGLTDEQFLSVVRKTARGTELRLTRDVGPYEVTELTHDAMELFRAIEREVRASIASPPGCLPRWPHRYEYFSSKGYVVWRDVFEGDMRCALDDAVRAHTVAVFVTESEASDYCNYRNARTLKFGTDDVSAPPTPGAQMHTEPSSSLPASGVEAWRPIETAPKDHYVLLRVPTRNGHLPFSGKWIGFWCIVNSDLAIQRVDPTHWMPLPQPPSAPLQDSARRQDEQDPGTQG